MHAFCFAAAYRAGIPEWKRTLETESSERFIRPSPWMPLLWSWSCAVLVNGVGFPLAWTLIRFDFPPENRLAWLAFLLPPAGLCLLFRAGVATVGAWRWRRVRFRLRNIRAMVGGRLTDLVEIPGHPVSEVTLSLACLETVTETRSDWDENVTRQEKTFDPTRVLWERSAKMEARPGFFGIEAPVDFMIPVSCRQTSREPERLGPETYAVIPGTFAQDLYIPL